MGVSQRTTASRARNPRGQGERLREALLDAATELLANLQDMQALSVRAVTARAGVTPTALYLHFEDKESLLAAVKERCFGELNRYLELGRQQANEPRGQLEAMSLAYVRFAAEQPGYYRVLFHTAHGKPPADPSASAPAAPDHAWTPNAAQAFGALVEAVARCLPAGTSVQPTATVVWAGLHGYVGLRRALSDVPFPDETDYIRALLDGQLGAAGETAH